MLNKGYLSKLNIKILILKLKTNIKSLFILNHNINKYLAGIL